MLFLIPQFPNDAQSTYVQLFVQYAYWHIQQSGESVSLSFVCGRVFDLVAIPPVGFHLNYSAVAWISKDNVNIPSFHFELSVICNDFILCQVGWSEFDNVTYIVSIYLTREVWHTQTKLKDDEKYWLYRFYVVELSLTVLNLQYETVHWLVMQENKRNTSKAGPFCLSARFWPAWLSIPCRGPKVTYVRTRVSFFLCDTCSTPYTDGRGGKKGFFQAVKLWERFHETLLANHSTKIAADLRGACLESLLHVCALSLTIRISAMWLFHLMKSPPLSLLFTRDITRLVSTNSFRILACSYNFVMEKKQRL